MRFSRSMGVALAAATLVATAPTAASAAGDDIAPGAWEPAPQGGFEMPAGARCEFAVRVEPVVDEVVKLTISTYPDGSPEREMYRGPLILRVTNLETGATATADASGSALVNYGTEGSMTWHATGPALFGFRENGGTLPKGLWLIDGVYVIEFAPTGQKTVTMRHGTAHNLCTDVD